MAKQAELQAKNADLRADCSKYAALDPEYLEKQKQNVKIAFEAANRWTDNIFAVKSFCVKERSIPEATFDQHFDIPDNFDYIELKKK